MKHVQIQGLILCGFWRQKIININDLSPFHLVKLYKLDNQQALLDLGGQEASSRKNVLTPTKETDISAS